MNAKWLNLFFIFSLMSCAQGLTKVESNPTAATVFASGDGMSEQELGVTPLSVSGRQFRNNRRYTMLSVRKAGYLPETLLVPASMFEQDIELSSDLQQPKEDPNKEPIKSYEKLAVGIAKTQRFIQSNQLDLAKSLVESLMTEYKNVSILYDFAGNIAYLQNNFSGALKFYEKSLTISPGKPETLKIIEKLKSTVR